MILAGVVGGERRVDVIELLALRGNLSFKGEGCAKTLAIGRKTVGGIIHIFIAACGRGQLPNRIYAAAVAAANPNSVGTSLLPISEHSH